MRSLFSNPPLGYSLERKIYMYVYIKQNVFLIFIIQLTFYCWNTLKLRNIFIL